MKTFGNIYSWKIIVVDHFRNYEVRGTEPVQNDSVTEGEVTRTIS